MIGHDINQTLLKLHTITSHINHIIPSSFDDNLLTTVEIAHHHESRMIDGRRALANTGW